MSAKRSDGRSVVSDKQHQYQDVLLLVTKTQDTGTAEKELPVKVPKQPVAFKQLVVKSLVANTWTAVIIHLPQATLEVTEETSQQTIQTVLLALQSVC